MYIEADLLYAYLKHSDWLKSYAQKIIKNFSLTTSSITIIEVEIVSKRDISIEFSNSVFDKLSKIKTLKIIPLDKKVLKKAVEFRKKYGLNIFDAAHAATAFLMNKKIVGTDRIFDIMEEIKRIDPRELK